MKFSELTPEEKLYCAIFGESSEINHWLSEEGKEALESALKKLAEKYGHRGIEVLRYRVGLIPRTDEEKAKRPGSDAHSLAETGVHFNVTRERIRQIEAKTIRLLRYPSRSRILKQYLPELR